MNPPGLVKFDDASPEDIVKVIKHSPTKSCLLDPWPAFLVKDCLDILLPSITKLVNCSLSEGAVPDGFKSAVVTPLIKKSSLSNNNLKNYRPLSGLSFILKLVERVVASQLSRHVSLHGLENENQSAYRCGHSTETALLSINNQIHLSLARGEATAVVLLDQSAAFDTIDHDKLLDCLRKWFGVRGRCLDWFKSYLSDRTQCTKIGSVLSETRKLKFGVPQGSVLGPFLFLLYTTCLSKVISKYPDVKFHFCANDTQLFIHQTHKNAKIAFDRLGKCLEDVKLWLCANKLKLNADKTDFIIFGSKSQQEKLLLDCLRKWFGVGGRCLDWFKSYLSDRTQCTKIGSVLSETRKLKFGVPQGSVLGPFLFSLYTTPLSKLISKHPDVKFHFCANDTQLFIHLTHKNAKIAFDRLGKCLEDVKLWLCANKLKLNADKTDFIIFGSKSQQEKLLLDCLRKWFSVGGRCLDWFKSYLSDRTQCTKIGSVLSETRKLKFGVPQGSVLGPFLFFLVYHTFEQSNL